MYMFGVVRETHAHDYFEVISFYNRPLQWSFSHQKVYCCNIPFQWSFSHQKVYWCNIDLSNGLFPIKRSIDAIDLSNGTTPTSNIVTQQKFVVASWSSMLQQVQLAFTFLNKLFFNLQQQNFVAWQCLMWVVIRATTLFNYAFSVEEKCCPYYRALNQLFFIIRFVEIMLRWLPGW